MRIAVDAMGGDRAPRDIVKGALLSVRQWDLEIVLVGREDLIQKELSGEIYPRKRISIRHCTEFAGMGESPVQVIRQKKDASIRVAFEMLKAGEVEALVSAGNSGATMALGVVVMGKLAGVDRPALAGVFPSLKGPAFLIDVGANVDCGPNQLLQFGIMAHALAKYVYHIPDPSVGLLSIGEEDTKGNELVRNTHELLKMSRLNFIGNVEGRDIFQGKSHVIVCDGFVGNVCLKLSEGLAEAVGTMLKQEIRRTFRSRLGYLLMKEAFGNFSRRVDYAEYGGVPLLGINGVAVISHGSSSPRAMMNAIRVARDAVDGRINDHLMAGLEEFAGKLSPSPKRKWKSLSQLKEKLFPPRAG
jgi:glycerol-3-phosphate acyltransferase PlsX